MPEEKDTTVDTEKMSIPQGYTRPKKVNTGPILGILILVLVVMLGGLYLWGSLLSKEAPVEEAPIDNNEPETPRAQEDINIMGALSTSDDLGVIEADLSSTNLDSLITDITSMMSEIDRVFPE